MRMGRPSSLFSVELALTRPNGWSIIKLNVRAARQEDLDAALADGGVVESRREESTARAGRQLDVLSPPRSLDDAHVCLSSYL